MAHKSRESPRILGGATVETARKGVMIETAMTVEVMEVQDAQDASAAETGITHRMAMTGNSKMANTGNKQPKRPRHIPLRTCVSCKETKPKRELLRIVRTPDGHVVIDATGKKSGRGAYLCARLSCWENAIKKKRLEQEFELTLSEEDRAGLDAYIATLPRDTPIPAQPTRTKQAGKVRQGS